MEKLSAIVLDGKVYEAVRRGSYHCSECDLYQECKKAPADYGRLCLASILSERVIFRYSQSITDKLNNYGN